MQNMIEVTASNLEQYIVHYVSDTLILGGEAFPRTIETYRCHLQSVSEHPPIKDGELFISLFGNCLWRPDKRKIIAIVKNEKI